MGDGNFQWWWSLGADPESYHGPCETREEAMAEAQAGGGKEEGFTICEADRSVPTVHVFDAFQVFERYEECNEECWGYDGADVVATHEQKCDLEQMLGDAFRAHRGARERIHHRRAHVGPELGEDFVDALHQATRHEAI